jgi:hypothetical protein
MSEDHGTLTLYLGIKSKQPARRTRPWPSPFTEKNANDGDKKAFYLIGLEDACLSKGRLNTPLESLCNDFFKQFTERGASDPTISWVDISIVEKRSLGEIVCDSRNWRSELNQDPTSVSVEDAKASKPSKPSAVKAGISSEKSGAGKLRPASGENPHTKALQTHPLSVSGLL